MTNNDAGLRRVVAKLNELHLNGIDFHDVWGWVFDWDEKLSITENFQNARREELALTTLSQAGAIHTHHKENFLRDEHEWSMRQHGWPMYSGWEKYPASHRLYDFLWYIDGFNYDKFITFCNAHGFGRENPTTNPDGATVSSVTVTAPSPPRKIAIHQLEPKHYEQRTGKLTLSATHTLPMTVSGKTKRPDGEKYLQCLIMEKVFKSVNTIRNGVDFRTILGVNDPKITKKMEKKISNTVAEINKKVVSVGGPEKLIIILNKKVFLNSSYL